MSNNWVSDIQKMQAKYKTREWVKDNPEKLKEFLKFRLAFLEEELSETKLAYDNNDPEELVDGLIDLCVVAIGTLDAFGINSYHAWDVVLTANLNKEIGIKKERPNPLGLPDLMKPTGWTSPSHVGNHGKFHNL